MEKVLLIHLPYYKGSSWSLPIGLAYIASALLKAGLEVEVLDIYLLHERGQYSSQMLYRKLKGEKYLFIGFGAVFFDFSLFRKLSMEIRKICPDTFQVIGGQWASRIPDVLVNDTRVDAVVMGEGEEIIVQIADLLRSGKSIGELRYVHVKNKPRMEGFAVVQDLDKLPFPARHLFDMDFYRLEMWTLDPLLYFSPMVATRGCPRKCSFCNPLGGRSFRTRSPANIIQEIKELVETYRIKFFRFNDEVFMGSNEKVLSFCDAIEESGLKITFRIYSWSEKLSEEAIRRLKSVGCNRIEVGIESGSPRILKEMNKVQNLELAKQKLQSISDHGMFCGSGFLTGTHGETEETLQETKNYIKELHKIPNFEREDIHFIKVLVGTPLYDLAKERGLIGSDMEFLVDNDKEQMFRIINLTRFNQEEYVDILGRINNELARNYFSSIPRVIKRLFFYYQIDYRNTLRVFSVKDVPAIVRKLGYLLRAQIKALIIILTRPLKTM